MSIDKLNAFSKSVNVATELDEEELNKIGQKVLLGYEEDLKSMEEWLSDVKRIEELASLKSVRKSQPLPNSANVKLPLITKACLEYQASTYPEIIRDDKVVKTRIIGRDDDGKKSAMAKRVADFMNFQLLQENQEWELETDNLIFDTALVGFLCRKTYYDPVRRIIKSEICDPKEIIINADVKSLDDASRITQILHLRLNDFIEAKHTEEDNVPVFLASAVDDLIVQNENDELDKCIDVLEQHCKLDLDKDGYAEPYIVFVVKDSGKVLRIAPRFTKDGICTKANRVCYITPIRYFVDYHFLRSPKRKFQSVGFGLLLLHLNESSNSVLNQLLDAGQLANMQGGYKDARLKMLQSGNSLHSPGEWKDVKVEIGATLKDGMVPINYKEPSGTLFNLLNLLIEVSRDLTSSAQINNGTQSSENAKTGATLALQQAGKKIINSINKRFYRSLNNEFKQIFVLNSMYLDPIEYREILDDTLAVKATDFDLKSVSILPVADPTLSSDSQRIAEAQFVQSMTGAAGIDPIKQTKFILARSMIPNIMDIMVDEKAPTPPNPDLLKLQADMEHKAQLLNIEGRKLDIEEKKLLIQAHLAEGTISKGDAQSILALAQAEAVDANLSLKDYQNQLDAIDTKINAELSMAQMVHEKELAAAKQTQGPIEDANAPQAAPPPSGPGGMAQPANDPGTNRLDPAA
jgi:chaperonin GroES